MKNSFVVALLLCIAGNSMAQWNSSGTNTVHTNSGNVGIGIDPPLEKLHINGSVRGAAPGGALRISTGNGYVDIGPRNSSWAHFDTDRDRYYFNKSIYIDGGISSYNTNNLILRTADVSRITVLNSNGFVGLGKSDPEALLHVGTSNLGWGKTIRMILEPPQHTGAGWEFSVRDDTQNSFLGIGYGAEQFTIHHEGKVGIGTTDPVSTWGEKLHIYSASSNTGLRIGRGDGASGSFLSYSNAVLLGSGTNHPLILMTNGNGRMTIKENGTVGIGTESPQALLHVGSGSLGWGKAVRMILEPPQHTGADWEFSVRDEPNNSFFGLGYGAEQFTVHHNGNVGIGSLNPTAKLTVKGTVYSTEVKVDVNAGSGPDYVFEPTYNLPTLAETEAYIKANKHLPEVPSAKEMEANGINLSEMNMLLLKKVEELTLHLIEQSRKLEQQDKFNKDLLREIKMLKNEK